LRVEPGRTQLRFEAVGPTNGRLFKFGAIRLSGDSEGCNIALRSGWDTKDRRYGSDPQLSQLPAELVIVNSTGTTREIELRFDLEERLASWAEARERYRLEVEYVDRELGRLIDHMEELGILDDTLIVLTSDHGEGLGDHGLLGHINQLYDSLLRVPLIMHFPGRLPAGVVVDEAVSLIDLYPTLVDMMGLRNVSGLRGRSLLPLIHGGTLPPRPILAETYRPEAPLDLKAIVAEAHKYIATLGEAPAEELYDLAVDPSELDNLVEQQPQLTSRLRETMESELATASQGQAEQAELTEEDKERLRALGYLRD
jgi:arylsulfatase A-like enzyme